MKESKVIKVAYNTIKDALEWGLDSKAGDDFAQYVDGVVGMTEALLDEMGNTIDPCDICEYKHRGEC